MKRGDKAIITGSCKLHHLTFRLFSWGEENKITDRKMHRSLILLTCRSRITSIYDLKMRVRWKRTPLLRAVKAANVQSSVGRGGLRSVIDSVSSSLCGMR